MARRGFAIDRDRHAGTAAWAACAVLGALALWLFARLAWQFFPHGDADVSTRAPGPESAAAGAPARSVASWHLFGDTPRAAGADGEVASTLALILRGTVADRDPKAGFAVIAGADGVERSFRVGQDVVSGVQLAAVYADRAVLSRGGAEET